MSYHFPPNLEQMVRQYMSLGRYSTEDELLFDAMLALENVRQREEELRTEIQTRISNKTDHAPQPLDREAFKAEARQRLENRQ